MCARTYEGWLDTQFYCIKILNASYRKKVYKEITRI